MWRLWLLMDLQWVVEDGGGCGCADDFGFDFSFLFLFFMVVGYGCYSGSCGGGRLWVAGCSKF